MSGIMQTNWQGFRCKVSDLAHARRRESPLNVPETNSEYSSDVAQVRFFPRCFSYRQTRRFPPCNSTKIVTRADTWPQTQVRIDRKRKSKRGQNDVIDGRY